MVITTNFVWSIPTVFNQITDLRVVDTPDFVVTHKVSVCEHFSMRLSEECKVFFIRYGSHSVWILGWTDFISWNLPERTRRAGTLTYAASVNVLFPEYVWTIFLHQGEMQSSFGVNPEKYLIWKINCCNVQLPFWIWVINYLLERENYELCKVCFRKCYVGYFDLLLLRNPMWPFYIPWFLGLYFSTTVESWLFPKV